MWLKPGDVQPRGQRCSPHPFQNAFLAPVHGHDGEVGIGGGDRPVHTKTRRVELGHRYPQGADGAVAEDADKHQQEHQRKHQREKRGNRRAPKNPVLIAHLVHQ